MAPRFGFTKAVLQRMDASACDSDARLLFKSGDKFNLAIRTHDGSMLGIHVSSARELRLLGHQMIAMADRLSRVDEDEVEMILP